MSRRGLSGFREWLKYRLPKYPEIGVLVGFFVVFISFSVVARHFLTSESLGAILTIGAELGIVAVGVGFLMICGEFDLSVGSVLGLSSMIFAILANTGVDLVLALVISLALAGLMGLMNGMIVVKAGIPSFIVTLGTMMLWRGVVLAISGGFPVVFAPSSPVKYALSGRFAGDFRTSTLWFVAITLILTIVINRTPYGNRVFATGGNKEVAKALGVNVNRTKLMNFTLSGILAGFAGCIQFSRFGSVDALRGTGVELEAIAAAVIGGTLLTGGYGSLIGTLFGALLIGMVRSGLVMAGAPAYWYRAFIGVILIIAVIINTKVRGLVMK